MSINPYQTPNVDMHAAVSDDLAPRTGSYNAGLVFIHGLFCLLYIGIAAALFFGSKRDTFGIGFAAFFGVIASAHLFGAIGAYTGSNAGRWVTRILGILMLTGFPLGTLIGIFMLMRTGENRWESREHPFGGNW